MRQPRVPKYRLHKSTGQAVVTLNGRDYYLGRYNTPESRRRYEQLLAEWLAAGRREPVERAHDLTVEELLDAYWGHAQGYYVDAQRRPTKQLDRVRRALGPARDLYGATLARSFGPAALRACREWMVQQGWCRRVINQRVGCLARAFKWATAEELIPASVYHGLRAVEGLKAGRTDAPESSPVEPAPEAAIAAVEPYLPPVLWDVVQMQLLTAMRPGEALALRPCDIDRKEGVAGDVWVYQPPAHKTRYRGHSRIVLLGPRAQRILAPYLLREPTAYCFSAREAMERRLEALGRKVRFGKRRTPGDRYREDSYSHAILRACRRAKVQEWHPHQLRHNAATRLTEQFGIEVSRIILGHRHISTTQLYAADSLAKAAEVMRQVG